MPFSTRSRIDTNASLRKNSSLFVSKFHIVGFVTLKAVVVSRNVLRGGAHLVVEEGRKDVNSHRETGTRRSGSGEGSTGKVRDLDVDHEDEGAKVLDGDSHLETVVGLTGLDDTKRSEKTVKAVEEVHDSNDDRDLREGDSKHGDADRRRKRAASDLTEREGSERELDGTNQRHQTGVRSKAATVVVGGPVTGLADLECIVSERHEGQ